MGFGWQEIDKTLDLGYIRVAGLHRECKPVVLFEPPNVRPRTMTHVCMYVQYVFTVCMYVCTVCMFVCTLYMYSMYVCVCSVVSASQCLSFLRWKVHNNWITQVRLCVVLLCLCVRIVLQNPMSLCMSYLVVFCKEGKESNSVSKYLGWNVLGLLSTPG